MSLHSKIGIALVVANLFCAWMNVRYGYTFRAKLNLFGSLVVIVILILKQTL
jgi:hypothetical protein